MTVTVKVWEEDDHPLLFIPQHMASMVVAFIHNFAFCGFGLQLPVAN